MVVLLLELKQKFQRSIFLRFCKFLQILRKFLPLKISRPMVHCHKNIRNSCMDKNFNFVVTIYIRNYLIGFAAALWLFCLVCNLLSISNHAQSTVLPALLAATQQYHPSSDG